MNELLSTFWGILLEVSPFVILGMLAAGGVHEALGRFRTLRGFARRRSLGSLSFFNLAGFILPICSCGVVPLAVALKKQGVPLGNLFSFVFSAPATSIAAVILSTAVLGADFTLLYVIGALLCGYAVGGVFYLVDGRAPRPPVREAVYLCDDSREDAARRGFIVRALRWGTVDYGSRIAFDLMIGLTVAAALVSTYSIQALGDWLGSLPFWQAAGLTIAIAIPLYVCSLPGILVGGSLALGGFGPGLIWIFLMAGPVTNLGDINVMRRNLGWRSTLLYVGTVVAVTFLWGMVVNASIQWSDLWAHTREYYETHGTALAVDSDLAAGVADSAWLALPPIANYASALLLLLLTANGARLAGQELWANPCLHCKGFQADLRMNPAICQQPCWKRRVLRLVKGGSLPGRLAGETAAKRGNAAGL